MEALAEKGITKKLTKQGGVTMYLINPKNSNQVIECDIVLEKNNIDNILMILKEALKNPKYASEIVKYPENVITINEMGYEGNGYVINNRRCRINKNADKLIKHLLKNDLFQREYYIFGMPNTIFYAVQILKKAISKEIITKEEIFNKLNICDVAIKFLENKFNSTKTLSDLELFSDNEFDLLEDDKIDALKHLCLLLKDDEENFERLMSLYPDINNIREIFSNVYLVKNEVCIKDLQKFNELSKKVDDLNRSGIRFHFDNSYMGFLRLKGALSAANKNKELMDLFKIVPISILTKEEYDIKQKPFDIKGPPSFDLVFGGFKQREIEPLIKKKKKFQL